MRKRRWTYNGIKRFYPDLSFESWLKICKRGQQYSRTAEEVVAEI